MRKLAVFLVLCVGTAFASVYGQYYVNETDSVSYIYVNEIDSVFVSEIDSISDIYIDEPDSIFPVYSGKFITSIEAVFRVNPNIRPFQFTTDGVERENLFRAMRNHTQGIAYSNGLFYITRCRPASRNHQQLVIVDKAQGRTVNQVTLDSDYVHPGGIQIYNNILAVPFETAGKNAKLSFFSLENPLEPELVGYYLFADNPSAKCLAITSFEDKYLVAVYERRRGYFTFFHFDKSFNKVAKQEWSAVNQNRENWHPFQEWQDAPSQKRYENMHFVQVRADSLSRPSYYLLMFHNNPDAIDVFSVSEPDLISLLDIQMVARIMLVQPRRGGFRMGGGMRIIGAESIEVFSTERHFNRTSTINFYSTQQ